MDIADVIRRKGSAVHTVAPTETVERLVALMAEHGIGALVVSQDGTTIDGIVSERDVVRHLAADGVAVLSQPVSHIMTSDVRTCHKADPVEGIAHTMTQHRIRHIPVVEDGRLTGVVSIGDVVKYRIDQLTEERNHLLGYLHT